MRSVTPRFFVEHRALAWGLLAASLVWGVWGYRSLPRRKDPAIVVPIAGVTCPWPGHRAAEVEREVTARLERALAVDPRLTAIQSVSRDHGAGLRLAVDERVRDPGAVFDAAAERLRAASDLPPGAGPVTLVRDLGDTAALLLALASPLDFAGRPRLAGPDLGRAAERLATALAATPGVARVGRSGGVEERIYADLDLGRLRARGLEPADLLDTLELQPLPAPGEAPDPALVKLFASESEIGRTLLGLSLDGPVTLADVAQIARGPETPPRQPVFLGRRTADGSWQRSPALVLDLHRRPEVGLDAFAAAVDRALATTLAALPADLVLARISDQARQVGEGLAHFQRSLVEAIALVILVALVAFHDRRAALLLAASIPATLALTFGIMAAFGIDLQQVSTASLILALGLLVDDPVVAADAILVELADGRAPAEAAWRGPLRLSRAILFATLTNIVAYLPLLLLSGNIGRFLYSLPVVLTAALVASRFVSMSFVPLLGHRLLRAPQPPRGAGGRRRPDLVALYRQTGGWALAHRRPLLAGALLLLLPGFFLARDLPTQFFPRDLTRLVYADLWLPPATESTVTADAARSAEERLVATAGEELATVTTFVGRPAPRFWFALEPAPPEPRYAQLLLDLADDTVGERLAAPLQAALDGDGPAPAAPPAVPSAAPPDRAAMPARAGATPTPPGAIADLRQLEIGKPVGVPVQIRLAGDDLTALAGAAREVTAMLAALPGARRVRSDWPELTAPRESGRELEPRLAAAAAIGGLPLGLLADDGRFVPVLARIEDRELRALSAQLASGEELASSSEIGALVRRDQRRTVTVGCFPAPGFLASQVVAAARPRLRAIAVAWQGRVELAFGGEEEEQRRAFGELSVVLVVSALLIFAVLALQFRGFVQPLLVFATLPFGALGALAALRLAGLPFGFMAFLGVASLLGVIVSHVLVLFDGIEEARRAGLPLERALLDAGLARLRPVLATVAATMLALLPLAYRGGPLWQPLCIAQLGGLGLATVVTLLLAPLLYAVAVSDLGWIAWPERPLGERAAAP